MVTLAAREVLILRERTRSDMLKEKATGDGLSERRIGTGVDFLMSFSQAF